MTNQSENTQNISGHADKNPEINLENIKDGEQNTEHLEHSKSPILFMVMSYIVLIILVIGMFIYNHIITQKSFSEYVNAQSNSEVSLTNTEISDKVIEKYLLNNGEVILESVSNYQAKQMENQMNDALSFWLKHKDTFINDTNNIKYVKSSKPTEKVIVEFFDYNCGYCRKAFSEMQDVLLNNDDITYILVHFPVLGATSVEFAKISLAVHKIDPAKFNLFHNELMLGQRKSVAETINIASKLLGVSTDEISKKANSSEVNDIIEYNRGVASVGLKIQGTPGYIMCDRLEYGYQSPDYIQNILDSCHKN